MDYSALWIFGCPVYSLVDSQKRNKLESKFKKCIFIGFTKEIKGFKLWDPEKMSTFTSRDVVFDEDSMLREKSEVEDKAQGGASDSSTADTQEKGVEFSNIPKRPEGSEENSSDSDGDKQKATQEQLRPFRWLVRVTVLPTRYDWDEDYVSFALVTETGKPDSYREAIKADDHDKWITTMEQERVFG